MTFRVARVKGGRGSGGRGMQRARRGGWGGSQHSKGCDGLESDRGAMT